MIDRISLKIPAKPDYLITARLTVASIASRMGFDVNDIEDIKTATAESCLLIMQSGEFNTFNIMVHIDVDKNKLSVEITGEKKNRNKKQFSEEGSLGQYLIEALSDEVDFVYSDDVIDKITFIKQMKVSGS
jgi:serine/threonine-protein kinase RsbW